MIPERVKKEDLLGLFFMEKERTSLRPKKREGQKKGVLLQKVSFFRRVPPKERGVVLNRGKKKKKSLSAVRGAGGGMLRDQQRKRPPPLWIEKDVSQSLLVEGKGRTLSNRDLSERGYDYGEIRRRCHSLKKGKGDTSIKR